MIPQHRRFGFHPLQIAGDDCRKLLQFHLLNPILDSLRLQLLLECGFIGFEGFNADG